MNIAENGGIIRRKVIERNSVVPYRGIEIIVVELTEGLPRAERTLTHTERYKLREANRVGERVGNGSVNIDSLRGRSQIGRRG